MYYTLLDKRISKLEKLAYEMILNKKLKIKNESVPLNNFDCEELESIIDEKVNSRFNWNASIENDNADYGYISVGVYNDANKYIVGFDVEADNYDSFIISCNNKDVATAESFEEIADIIVKEINKKYYK